MEAEMREIENELKEKRDELNKASQSDDQMDLMKKQIEDNLVRGHARAPRGRCRSPRAKLVLTLRRIVSSGVSSRSSRHVSRTSSEKLRVRPTSRS